MVVFVWLLVSLLVFLEPLHGQSSVTLASQATVAPGITRTWLYLNLSFKFDLVGPHTKSLVALTLPHMCSPLDSFSLISKLFNDLKSPDIIKHFREADATQLILERSRI